MIPNSSEGVTLLFNAGAKNKKHERREHGRERHNHTRVAGARTKRREAVRDISATGQ